MSEDPIRFATGNFNLYNYVRNQPVNISDPSGLDACLFIQFGHTYVAVDDPKLQKILFIDFHPDGSRVDGLYSSVDATVDISDEKPFGGVKVPGSCTEQSDAEDQALIERAKELQKLAKNGQLKYSVSGSLPNSMNCWMFSGAIR